MYFLEELRMEEAMEAQASCKNVIYLTVTKSA